MKKASSAPWSARRFWGLALCAVGSVLSVSALWLLLVPEATLVVDGVAHGEYAARLQYALYAFGILGFGLFFLHGAGSGK